MKLTAEQQKLVESMVPYAKRLSHKYCPGDSDAESVAYLALCKAVRRHNPEKAWTVRTYCLKWARRDVINYMLEKHRRPERRLDVDPPSKRSDPREIFEIMDLLNILSPKEKRIFIGHYLDGESMKTIGLVEGCSRQRVHQILQDCLRRLRREIDGEPRSNTSSCV